MNQKPPALCQMADKITAGDHNEHWTSTQPYIFSISWCETKTELKWESVLVRHMTPNCPKHVTGLKKKKLNEAI